MVVQHNMNALTAYNKLNANVAGLKKSSEKLASGYRINRAGDDAAGLAISEKMRSQIKGLNQAIRNSQDGINMVQTFEGAAQETHSILQRMKELATESANGTYDNPTDRAAIQLEFDQLNDELNQIADTDFNGTVVLNGGVMADGTVAKNGEFNYKNGYTETVVANEATDISSNQAHTIVEQQNYTKEIADAVWNAVGADVNKNQTLDVTFMYDGERWVANTVTSGGEVVEGARASGLEARPVNRNDASGNGGFQVIAGKNPNTSEDIIATNAIFDEMEGPVKKGDTVTIRFENSKETTYAPKNAGIDECFKDGKPFEIEAADTSTLTIEAMKNKVSFTLGDAVTDGKMTEEMNNVLKALDGIEITATYAAGEMTGFELSTDNITDEGAKKVMGDITIEDDGTLYYKKDDDTKKVLLGKVTAKNVEINVPEHIEYTYTAQATKITKTNTFTDGNGDTTEDDGGTNKFEYDGTTPANATKLIEKIGEGNLAKNVTNVELTFNAGTSKVTGKVNFADGTSKNIAAANAADFGLTYTGDANDVGDINTGAKHGMGTQNKITVNITATPKTVPEQLSPDPDAAGTVKFGLNLDAFNYADMSNLSVHAIATPTAAKMSSQVAEPGVTQANAFKNSTARMTYTDNITLQTGARTKDAVNFSFSYNTDKSADMGDLLANLDLSARSTGLNTANLSLANQDDANYAIDQIDKAINKTSMVRATFGSIQNRLEHKITNLTTTAENLTEAESSIRDTDMANEMMNYTKFNILQQAAQSMLAQANQQPQSILQLLG